MKNEPIALLTFHSHRLVFLLFALFIFTLNLGFKYASYGDFKQEELLEVQGEVLNIYTKDDFDTLKIRTSSFDFFTSIYKGHTLNKTDQVKLYIDTRDVDFYEYLKGFYAFSFNYEKLFSNTLRQRLYAWIASQHNETKLQELFGALFLALPLNTSLRDFFASLGLSHLIAISGFHLAVLSACIYGVLSFVYLPFHQRYFPYSNKRYHLLLITFFILFLYLLLTQLVPSLLRAFVMMSIGLYFLRFNIKVLSFESLFIVMILILSLFPSYMFSLSLWFSLIGVFYIFLYLHYFKHLNKYVQLVLFNVWIFLAFNPIVHYFFAQTSLEQLVSPLLTILFTLFYPFELLLHFLSNGFLLDTWIEKALNYSLDIYWFKTPLWFFLLYTFSSFFSIWSKKAFILLHVLLVGFNVYLFGSHLVAII